MKRIQLSFLILILLVSCNNKNKLNTDEQKLANEIKAEEQEKLVAEQAAWEAAPSIPDSLPPGFRFQEDRSVDTEFPPKIIDVANFYDNKKNYQLSDVVSNIEYVILEDIPVKSNYKTNGYISFLFNNHILISTMGGLYLFNRDGTFKDVICEEMDRNRTPQKSTSGLQASVLDVSAPLKGSFGKVWSINNKLFYEYSDRSANKNFLMSYEMDSPQNSIPPPDNGEDYQISGKGEVEAILSSERGKRYPEYIPTGKNTYLGIKRKWRSARSGLLMTSFNMDGDTLCNFPDHETISNFSHSVMRGNFPQYTYQYGETVTFLNAFNDTVYRIIPPNRLLPVYIFNMGNYKIEPIEGFTPGQDISEKLYISEFLETKDYIYLNFTSGYDSFNNRKGKAIKIYYAIYEKENGQLYRLPVNPKGYHGVIDRYQNFFIKQGILNDIDGGLLFWPERVSSDGEIYEVVSGEKLKKHINSDRFNYSSAPQSKKEELITLAEKVRNDQLILIVYE